jgi:DNA-directed RNA polymerase subunit M/transcription elongation factor TFIIS
MGYKAKVVIVGSDSNREHNHITLALENVEALRDLASKLYLDVVIVTDKAIGGSDVCETCTAHCQEIEDLLEQKNLIGKRLEDLIKALEVRKVGKEWGAIDMVIKSTKKSLYAPEPDCPQCGETACSYHYGRTRR